MIRSDDTPPTRAWTAALSPLCVRASRPWRRRLLRRLHGVAEVRARGLSHLRQVAAAGRGVLITPNHPRYADPLVMLEVGDRAGLPAHYLTAREMFEGAGPFARWVMRRHGCFSVDRDGHDVRALREAVNVVAQGRHPLVIFPEGYVYHRNGRLVPFRSGAAAVARAAARRAGHPIAWLPCAIGYEHVADPSAELSGAVATLERHLELEPDAGVPLYLRVRRVCAEVLVREERRRTHGAGSGPLRRRTTSLAMTVLSTVEEELGLGRATGSIPERVTAARRGALALLADASSREAAEAMLEDLHLVVQLYSYPPGYLSERPTTERLAETIARLEEDVLGIRMGRPRGLWRATVDFGAPVQVLPDRGAGQDLTAAVERGIHELLGLPAARFS